MSTIASISTAPGIGGIGIIRMSGEKCFEILNKIFYPKNNYNIEDIKGYTIKYGHIKENEKTIDEVLVSFFKAPHSYTAENMCEINSHGGIVVMRRILDLCLKNGAELAQPGEFTKRAFLNGRMDLSQAEAVIDIINAKSDIEAKEGIKQLEGFLAQEIVKIKQKILDLMTSIEVSIDYPEYDVDELLDNEISEKLESIKNELQKLEKSFYNGKVIKEGIKTAIIGKPNAGKSSLLNAILKEDRAIVTEYEGTTRDTIEEFVNINGIPLKLIDTAGIRDTENEIEKIGIEKSKKIAKEADLCIVIIDSSKNIEKEDEEILKSVDCNKSIVVLNKSDLGSVIDKTTELINKFKYVINISALKRDGINDLYDTINKMFNLNEINLDNEIIITNERHRNIIKKAINNVEKAEESLKNGMPIDIVAISIKDILSNLGEITGDEASEEIIDEIFARFCLGK
ncbi:MAG TPA: tRNA uridine-5-carboxymethylaminomethyl(34) synthesis GTPase MnmE [Clostridiales bacterium]|nr:tRNA uridine-5-carboxymethylaminomethyl(34) synthesis GTPase MnmE [Clostridiales bacterium]